MVAWTYREAVEVSVLGPLRVSTGTGPVEIRGVKERVLLAMLVAHAGRPVPVADLVEALWGDAPPRTAAKSLQTYVLRLRNVLEPAREGEPRLLVTEGQGYRLQVDPRQVDAGRFERLVAAAERARPRERAALLKDALELWRGRAYADLESAPGLSAEATRLEQLRLAALEERYAAELELGRHRSVVPELERLVAQHPLRERAWALLMTGLYRDGRQADALAAYDRARHVLAEELGIDPGTDLRELHARVLAQDPDLGRAPTVADLPAALRDPGTGLHGRDAELDVLRREWERTADGGSRVVLVTAPVGGGALRLATALAEEVAEAGHPVVHVGPDGADPAGPHPGRALVVRDRVPPGPDSQPGLELRLAPPGTAATGVGAVLDLAPLPPEAVRALVAEHVAGGDLDAATERVLEHSGGWPGRAHAAARSWLRDHARATVRTAVSDADTSLGRLQDARRRLAAGVLDLHAEPSPEPDDGRCPWPALEPYDVDDGAWFAGRERLVAELVARVSGVGFLAVVGASGSGKSSAVRAGLLAALAEDALPGSAGWTRLVMRPGAHPMRELAHRVLGARRPDAGAILEHLVRDGDPGDHTVLVVDQCEELWTTCHDEGEREAFLDTLADLVADPSSGVTVVVALRADYLDRVADHGRLARLVGDHSVLVGAPTPDDVRRVAELPARRAGLEYDVGLVDAVVEDAGAEPGLLPLLSTSLAQLWEAREGRRLTFAGYVGSGGLQGAIGHLAERAWDGLDEDRRPVARALLLRLTGPGEGTAVTRRRVALAELAGLPGDRHEEVVEQLAEARLLTLSDGHVEVAHEALFREWPRLRGWLAEDAAGRAVQRRLAVAAGEWDAEGRDPGLLWRGTRLEAGLEVVAARPEEVTAVEQAFLDASAASAEAEQAEVVRRADAEARQNRRLRMLLVGAAVLLVLATLAGLVALTARERAADAATEATQAAVAADARRLAASALNVEYPDLALLTAVEATRLERSPETYGALLSLLARQPDVVTRYRTPDRFLRNAASPDGRTVYVSENGPWLRALDAATGEERWSVDVGAQVGKIAPSPDGRLLALTVLTPPEGEIVVLDAADGRVRHRLPMSEARRAAPGSAPYAWFGLGWTADERLVFASDTHVFVAGADTGVREVVPWGRAVFDNQSLTVWPDGHVSTGGSEVGPGLVLDLDRPRAPAREYDGLVMAVSPDSSRALRVVVDETGSRVQVLAADTLRPTSEAWPVEGEVRHAQFSDDGSEVAVAVDEQVLLRDGRTAAPRLTLRGHSGSVMSVAWAGERDDLLWTAGRDGSAVGFDTTGRRGTISERPSPDAPHAGETAAGVRIWTNFEEVELNRAFLRLPGEHRGRPLPVEVLDDCRCQPGSTDLTADGAVALAGYLSFTPEYDLVDDRGALVAWDTATRGVLGVVRTPWPVMGVDTTPDGSRAVLAGPTGWAVLDLATLELSEPLALPEASMLSDGTGLVEVSPAGDRAVLLRGEDVALVDLDAGKVLAQAPLWEADADEPVSAAWDDDGRVAIGSLSGWRYVLEGETLTSVVPRRLVTGGFVIDVEISPDGRVAATLGTDGDVLLWDARTWRPYGEPVLDDLEWGFLAFTEDSETLQVEYEAGLRFEIDARPAAWVTAACAAANRDLTSDESAVVRPGLAARPTCA